MDIQKKLPENEVAFADDSLAKTLIRKDCQHVGWSSSLGCLGLEVTEI